MKCVSGKEGRVQTGLLTDVYHGHARQGEKDGTELHYKVMGVGEAKKGRRVGI